jgi:predicted RNase H-like HicB family nuclease
MPSKSRRSSRPTKSAVSPSKGIKHGLTSRPTVRPKASGKRANNKRLDRPFAADTLKAARSIVGDYQIILECEDGHWYGRGLELPHVYGDGETSAACIAATREALTAAAAYLLEQGQAPPSPAKQGKRTTQVNVRLTAEEKAILEGTARRKGFEGLSDFLRAAALEAV